MTCKIKSICLALVAVAAMSMAVASAQAFEMHVTTAQKALLTGEQTTAFVLQTDAGQVKCNQVLFEGTVEGGSPQITNQHSTLTPTLTECQFFGLNATINVNGCKYTITNKSATGVTTALTAYVDITGCTTGKQFEVIASGCTFTAPQQHHIGHVVFQNTPGAVPHDVHASVTLSGITYEFHGAFCPAGGNTELTHNGTTHGLATFRAFKHLGTELKTHNGHQYSKGIRGEAVGLLAT